MVVEAATWRPLAEHRVGAWRLGLSGGFTRRANCVLVTEAPLDVVAAMDESEAFYAAHGLPCVVRADVSTPTAVVAELDRRGYRLVATTAVLVRDLPAEPGRADLEDVVLGSGREARLTTADHAEAAWVDLWLNVKTATAAVEPGDVREVARQIVNGSPASYLTVWDGDQPVAVARVAHAGEWAGLSCLMVGADARRRGLAVALTSAAMHEAARHGAARAFLQVEIGNQGATVLYRRMGFEEAERYHYREQERILAG